MKLRGKKNELFDERELATVLAALRYWQRELDAQDEESRGPISAEHFGDGTEPLTSDEIDQLCERLNRA